MRKILYVYQNYRSVYSSASLSILRGFEGQKNVRLEVFEFKPVSYNHFLNRVFNRIPWISKLHFKNENQRLKKIIGRGEFDAIFIMKGTDLKYLTLQEIKRQNSNLKLICFNPDDPFNQASSNPDIVNSIKVYDIYCIWTKHLNNQLLKAGAKQIYYFPFGVDEEIIYPVDSEYLYDVSFIGNGDTERHLLISSLADELTKRGLNLKIHVFGNNWPSFGNKVIIHGQRNGKELLKTIAASRINLNLLRKQNKNSINMRTFEIPAARGFMLHESSEEARSFFESDTEMIYFDSTKDLVDKCEHFLTNSDIRESIKSNSFDVVNTGNYSYKWIVKKLLESIQ